MSRTSKLILGLSCGFTVGIFCYVHIQQQEDINKMHEGVIRDVERQRLQVSVNQGGIEKQDKLPKALKNHNRDEEV